MALEVVGGAFLSASFQEVFHTMASGEVMDFLRGNKMTDRLLKKLKIKMLSVNSVLGDAEVKQLTDSNVKEWLNELKGAVYDAEDLLEDIKTEAGHHQFGGRTSHKVQEFISASFHAFDHTALNSRIEEILETLEFIVEQKDPLNLKTDGSHGISDSILPPPTTSLVESDVYGRDEEKESFIKLLLSDDATGKNLSVIPIVGMGGIGKTTFAQLLYNDDRVKQHFDICAWVCVSKEFDVFAITKTIYESITKQTCDMTNLDLLQLKLKEALTGKKFLFVHDDIWNENYTHWVFLRRHFESGAYGSKIIVTTRNEHIALMMSGTLQSHRLNQISEEDCWLIFAKHAFESVEVSAHSDLEVIGRKIVRKCNGLLLAAKSLGGLLRSKLNIVEEWENILNSDIWEISHEKSNILPALWLSYHYLPPYLKRCFAYSSIFPKNYAFEKSELVLLWNAEDLLEFEKKKMMVEEVGEKYFDDLTSRSFFQRAKQSNSMFVMLDLINDLAKFVSGEFCVSWEENYSPNIRSKTRHFSYMEKYYGHGFEQFEALYDAKYLRTFLSCGMYGYVKLQIMLDKITKLHYLRVLKLSHYRFKELPDSIGKLNHLRYLDLSYTLINKLPDTLCTMYNLQTLLLSYCKVLAQLPTNLGRLMKLRHLDIVGTELQKMPAHMGKLKDLRMLNYFVLDKHSAGHDILELKELRYLRGTLGISGLCNLAHAKDALEDNIMRDKKYLSELVLEWGSSATDDSPKEREREMLEKLQPHTNLKELKIDSYGGTTFPSWLRHHSSCKLVSLQLVDCPNIVFFPDGGLDAPNLTKIEIRGCEKLRSLPEEMHSLLPSLESLEIYNCPELESFPEGGLPSKLKILEIYSCKKLMANRMQWGLSRLTSLTELSLDFEDCEEVVDDSFPEEGMLPTTLTYLFIEDLLNVKKMDGKGFGHLNSLEMLWIWGCPELQCLPDEGLPHSLSYLSVCECPLLEERCERDKGEDWPKIAHIPNIWIDGMRI